MSDPLDEIKSHDPDESQETVLADQTGLPQHKRVVDVGPGTAHRFWSDWSEDVRNGGVFVATDDLLPVGEAVILNLRLQGEMGALAFLCEVRWVREEDENGVPMGFGLRLMDLDEADAERIQTYIQNEDIDVLIWDYDVVG